MNSSCHLSSSRSFLQRLLAPFLPGFRAAALVALALLAPVAGAQTLKLATLVPEGSIWDKCERELGAAIQTQTAGRVRFQIYPGGVAGDEPDLRRKLRIGQLQAVLFSSPGLGDFDPAFTVFQVPLFYETDEEVAYVLEHLRPVLEKRLADKDCILLHWTNIGWLRFFSSKPIASFDDFKARKHFVWGTENRLASWYQELGLRPVTLSGTDVLTGLQTGLIETVPATPLAVLALQWFRTAPYMLDHRFAPLLGGLVVSKSAWNKISEADREIVLRLSREAEKKLFAEIPGQEAAALAEMEKRGLMIGHEPASDSKRWLELGLEFQKRFRQYSVPPEIFDQAKALLEEVRAKR